MLHLGAWIDTLNGLVKPSLDKTQAINLACQDLLSQGCVSVRRLQSIVGLTWLLVMPQLLCVCSD